MFEQLKAQDQQYIMNTYGRFDVANPEKGLPAKILTESPLLILAAELG